MGNHLPILRLTKQPVFKRCLILLLNIKLKLKKANSVIIITGASSGIGRELALQYAPRGCR